MENTEKKQPLVQVKNLCKYFEISRKETLKAVDDLTFDIYKGETVSLVGESGCGKSTTGRTMIKLYNPTSGNVYYDGKDIFKYNHAEQKEFCKKVQMIFQNPYSSLNPRMTVKDIVGEGLKQHGMSTKDADAKVEQLLATVGLNKDHMSRFPHEFSGGQRQRIGIARALSVDPEFIICDEPISALDVSIQAQVINMLKELQEERERLGLNDPVLVQYGRWLGKVLHGDFGTSYSNGKPVAELLSVRLLPTLKLAFSALILMLLVAVPLGMLSAVYKNTWVDYLVRGVTFLGVSIPNFWVGLILLYVVALKFSLLPVISTGDGFEKIILPAITLAFAMAGKYTRQVRTAVLEELNKDYVTGARARGMSEQEILWKQVFPNALLPLITLLGLSLGNLLGGTAVVEVIFTYPGLGNLAVQAITAYDYSLIQGYVLWVALIYMVINLLVDMSYTFVDPRIRRNERG